MIKILKDKKKLCEPHYLLTIDYMIGDGDDTGEVEFNFDNEIQIHGITRAEQEKEIEWLCNFLKSLKPPKGSWGVGFGDEDLMANAQMGNVSKEDVEHFIREYIGVEDFDYDKMKERYENDDEDFDWFEYDDAFRDQDNAFRAFNSYDDWCLSFTGYELKYIDENGNKYKTEIVKE